MSAIFDRVKVTVVGAPGTGPITLGAAVAGFRDFSVVPDGTLVSYGIEDGTNWEAGRGTYSGGVLSRGPITSSNGNAAINASANAIVFISMLAEDFVVELGGNTSGTSTAPLLDMQLVGGSNVTLSGDGTAITINATGGGGGIGTLSLYAAGNTTGAASSTTAGASLTFEAANIASVGFSAGSIVISAASGTTAASGTVNDLFALGNTTGASSSTTATLTNLSFSGAGVASVGFSTTAAGAGVVQISVPAGASGTAENLVALGNTTAATSSSALTLTALSLSGAGGLSVGLSTTAAGEGVIVLSGATAAASQGSLSWFAVGNTTNSSSTSSALPEALSLSGGGIVTVGISSNTLIFSATTAAQTAPSLSLYAVGNTTSSVSSGVIQAGSLSLDGAGLISVGISGSSVVLSAPVSASLSAAGKTTAQTSSVADWPFGSANGFREFSASGIVSVGFSTSSASDTNGTSTTTYTVISAPQSAGIYAVGNTTAQTSSVASFPYASAANQSTQISGAGIVSVGFSTSTASDTNGTSTTTYEVISATTAASQGSLSWFAVGNTTNSSSTSSALPEALSLSGAGIVTVGISSNTLLFSATTAASGTANSIVALGNTTAATSSSVETLGSLSLSGAGIVSVGLSTTAANAGVVVISAPSPAASGTVQNQTAIGNTTGQTSSSTLSLTGQSISGAGIVSVGYSTTAAGSAALIISATTAASGTVANVSAVGNTTALSSSSSQTLTAFSLSGAGGVSIGMTTTAAGAAAIVISGATTAASGTVQSQSAIGNTTGQSSSSTVSLQGVSFSGAGGVSIGLSTTAAGAAALIISGATTAASGTVKNISASGNTTGQSSSSTQTLTAEIVSGAGIVSVGLSTTGAGAPALIISATTAASGSVLSASAIGNTTAQSSSSTLSLQGYSLSGAGIVSIGLSTTAAGSAAIIISATTAASGAVQNQFVIGNTTAATSSTTQTLSSISVSGAGAVSVGFSTTAAGAGALVISAPVAVASGTADNAAALGNTTGATSSSVVTISAHSYSGAGIVSVGFSTTAANAGVLQISASSATSLGLTALGNTTALTSSGSTAITGWQISAAGIASVGLSSSSIVISASSATNESNFVSGNTTALSSSTTLPITALTVSGAGGASVGFTTSGAGAGMLLISAPASGVATSTGNMFATGNTTGATSSSTQIFTSSIVSGAGIVSVGYTTTAAGAPALIVSATSATSQGITALGNTTALASSGSTALAALQFSGAGGVSIGLSSSTIVISGNTGGGGGTLSFIEPVPWLAATASNNPPVGTMVVAPMLLPQALSFNQAQLVALRSLNPGVTVSTTGATTTGTASATFGLTESLVVYSQQGGTSTGSFTILSSTTHSYAATQSVSVSFASKSSESVSQSVTLSFPQGTSSGVTASYTTSFTSAVAGTWSSAPAAANIYTGLMRNDFPFAATLASGEYLVGLMSSTASGSATGFSLITIGGPNWSGFMAGLTYSTPYGSIGSTSNTGPLGIGSTSSAAQAIPATIAWNSLSTQNNQMRLWFQFGMLP